MNTIRISKKEALQIGIYVRDYILKQRTLLYENKINYYINLKKYIFFGKYYTREEAIKKIENDSTSGIECLSNLDYKLYGYYDLKLARLLINMGLLSYDDIITIDEDLINLIDAYDEVYELYKNE